ncbi:MAG: FAD-binding oxidoreductase [Proteobacteria bacterium]|nr:FAD-binding oxidoreductase [Verrucomicrobiota bacterium]NBU08254.1 FAD-binding oxidoreductase [Pseudomonadota bacterium]
MTLHPASLADLSRLLADCHAAQRPVTSVDLAALAAVREYTPEDMTITAEGGLTLAALQTTLAARGQWLPIDPPHADRVTLRQLLSENLFGPRRCGFGTIREHLIGLEAVLPDGRVTHSGGRVVKNVAGYDLLKLFVGARDSLGIITAATFKLRPLPAAEIILSATFPSLAAAWTAVEAILASPVTPVILDLHNLAADASASATFTVRLGFAGTPAEVEWQRAHASGFSLSLYQLRGAGRGEGLSPHAPDPEQAFWSSALPVHTHSVLPSKLPAAIAALGPAPFLARAANGIIHHRSTALPSPTKGLDALSRRLKDTFDPHHILPALPA